MEGIFDQLNVIAPHATVDTGDVANMYAPESYDTYKALRAGLNHSLFTIPGNHDGKPHANYYAAGLTDHFYTEISGDIALIGILSHRLADLKAGVSAEELAWLEARLIEAEAGNKNIIVMAHHPLLEIWAPGITDGREELLALLDGYNVAAFLSGHRHYVGDAVTLDGTVHIDGGATSFGIGGPRMMYFERCAGGHLHMRNISARAPFGPMPDAMAVEIRLH